MAAAPRGEYEVLILGAGMSGLACASRLHQHEYFRRDGKLLVLEARDRIGGRIGSVDVHGCRLDTGANWIHGIGTRERPNPLMSILPHKRYRQLSGMVTFRNAGSVQYSSPENMESEPKWVEVKHADARPAPPIPEGRDLIVPSSVAGVLMGSLWSMIGSLHELANSTSAAEAKRTSMLQAIAKTDEFEEAYKNVPTEYRSTLGGMPQFIENMEAAPLAAKSAEAPEGQPGFSLLEFALDDFDGDQVFLQDGYTAVIEEVAKDLLDAGIVRLGTETKRIRWDQDRVYVETTAGTFTAKQLICTLPLGVLKSTAVLKEKVSMLFEPPLPQDKQQAIKSLGFGTLDKIFLIYEHSWWDEEPYKSVFKKGLVRRPFDEDAGHRKDAPVSADEAPDSIMGFTTELPGIEIHADGTTSSGARTLSLINLHNLTGFPVLSCFVSCANATHIETLSDDQAGALLQRALTMWFGREIPRPSAVHVTQWAQDEYSREATAI